jgi:glycosyltransferase involved in cell wall biosynthesis
LKFNIIYWRFYHFDGSKRFIGGIETYIQNLAELSTELGYDTTILQCAVKEFKIKTENYDVLGVKTPNTRINEKKNLKILYKKAIANLNSKEDIILFATDEWSIKKCKFKNISIQHGIAWDKPIELLTKKKMFTYGIGEQLKRYLLRRKAINFFNKAEYKVCVDYNFLNWYRTFYNSDNKIKVILNCTDHISLEKFNVKMRQLNTNKKIKVLFARRFEVFRGTRLMQEAIEEVLKTNKNIFFTLAGYGTDSKFLKEKFKNHPNVTFYQYTSEEALSINYEHDISIIPSIGSEGTSFSVAEALGGGAAVIATDTGGITNMILNKYNGLLIRPNSKELAKAIITLSENKEITKKLATKGFETATTVFSKKNWKNSWIDFIKEVKFN